MRLLLLILTSCGYTTLNAQTLPNGYKRVYVVQAQDNGTEVGPAATLTRVLRERIDRSRQARLSSLEDAEVVLEARIDSASDVLGTVAVANTKTVPKYNLTLNGQARLIDKKAAIVWSSGAVRVGEEYLTGTISCGATGPCSDSLREAGLPITENNRRRALERAAEQLANDIYDRMIEGF